jgi:tetratricopeptide (TPR) repeat protein
LIRGIFYITSSLLVELTAGLLLAGLILAQPTPIEAQSPAKPPVSPALRSATAALDREDFPAAESALRTELKAHPADTEALSLLGLALDGQKQFTEADATHRRAIAAAPRSATILSRYGWHLLSTGNEKDARDTLLKAAAIDPSDRYTNLQLAQWALRQKDPKTALAWLDHIPAAQQNLPEVATQRLIALDLSGSNEATALFNRLSAATENDAAAGASIGWALAQAGQFDQAETFLTHAHAANPSDFHVLYDLGVVALYAKHYERAREVLETARRQQPQNVDALYSLAFAESALHQPESAIRWLVQASQLAPQRADVQRLLAVMANELNAFEDSAAAWDRYATLAPNDDEARRERGFATIHLGKFDAGVADLQWYVSRHPDNAMGHYELGLAESASDRTQGLAELDKALQLDPNFMAARAVRGTLNYLQGKPEAALPDLEAVAAQTTDTAVLDRLGQTYLALDRTADAIRVLRKAADLPGEPIVLFHLANALAESGETTESAALMARYKQLRPAQGPVDLVRFLSMTPEQQHADYRGRVEKAIADNPRDPGAQSHYLKLLLEENRIDEAAATARLIVGLKPGADVLVDDGRALLEAKQYSQAKDLLEQAQAGTSDSSVRINPELAIATFHALGDTPAGAAEGLRELDRTPETNRNADYYLAKAQMLQASGKTADSLAALDQAIRTDPARGDLYWQKAIVLAGSQRALEALRFLDQAAAAKALPQEQSIPLTKAVVLELSGKTDEALHILDGLQKQSPEVAAVWVARGLILAAHQRFDEARRALETAVTHGARSAEAWQWLAEATLRSAPDQTAVAETDIRQALKLAADDPAIQDLADRIAKRQKDFPQESNALLLFEKKPPRDW